MYICTTKFIYDIFKKFERCSTFSTITDGRIIFSKIVPNFTVLRNVKTHYRSIIYHLEFAAEKRPVELKFSVQLSSAD